MKDNDMRRTVVTELYRVSRLIDQIEPSDDLDRVFLTGISYQIYTIGHRMLQDMNLQGEKGA